MGKASTTWAPLTGKGVQVLISLVAKTVTERAVVVSLPG